MPGNGHAACLRDWPELGGPPPTLLSIWRAIQAPVARRVDLLGKVVASPEAK